jgi:transposase
VVRFGADLQEESCPSEIRQFRRTIILWFTQTAACYRARMSNDLTEAIDNLIKRVKGVAFRLRRFANHRIQAPRLHRQT